MKWFCIFKFNSKKRLENEFDQFVTRLLLRFFGEALATLSDSFNHLVFSTTRYFQQIGTRDLINKLGESFRYDYRYIF